MADLSPAAQAVLDAVLNEASPLSEQRQQRMDAAAALRAAADQVVPYEKAPNLMRGHDLERLAQRQHTRRQLFAIAAELEAQ
jgi:hypothetical protein